MTKFISTIIFVFIVDYCLYAQVGIGTTTPHGSAALEVSSTDKGILIPRVLDVTSITAPAIGLLVFQTGGAQGFYYFDGSAWTLIGGCVFTHYIGEHFGGGVIFHLWKDSLGVEHGLIVATTDQATNYHWSNVYNELIGPTAQSSWDGLSNSIAIISQSHHSSSAAKLCLDLVSNGHEDWYLPSLDELSLLWHNRFNVNKTLSTIVGSMPLPLSNEGYWSSTERDNIYAWYFKFNSGFSATNGKHLLNYSVRAIRAF